MNRRQLIRSIFATLPMLPSYAESSMLKKSQSTSPTKFIDSTNPAILAAVEKVAPAFLPLLDRAVRIHDFVRDQIAFGWAAAFYEQTASEVLSSRIGYCNTKGTLFVAMLRAAGIPAKQHFVDIHSDVLSPFIDPGMPYVDHSYTEVFLNGVWLKVDSYIVDKPLFKAARQRLEVESKLLGFGVHRDGTCDWNGQTDAFAQFVQDGQVANLSRFDHGIFDDVGAFYISGKGVNRLNAFLRLGFGLFARRANQRINALRSAP